MSDGFKSIARGTTRLESTALASAPASKFSHGEPWFSFVTHTSPKFVASSAPAISPCQRAPALMSSDDTNGSMLLITSGSQSRRTIATSRLFWPDQLMNTFIVYGWAAGARDDAIFQGALSSPERLIF